MSTPPPTVSPDGRFYLDGGRWVPFPYAVDRRAAVGDVARGVATGVGLAVVQLLLATMVFPLVLAAAVLAAQGLLPSPADDVVSIAAAVVLVGVLVALLRHPR